MSEPQRASHGAPGVAGKYGGRRPWVIALTAGALIAVRVAATLPGGACEPSGLRVRWLPPVDRAICRVLVDGSNPKGEHWPKEGMKYGFVEVSCDTMFLAYRRGAAVDPR